MSNKPTQKSRASSPSLVRRAWQNLPLVAVVIFAGATIVAIAFLPLRTWVNQRELTANTEAELVELEAQVAQLEVQYELLQTDEEIERLGRENFDLVFPGEESYRVLPAPDE